MFDEMVERIRRTTIAVLLKVKVEIRPAHQPVRRQMPEQAAASGSGEVPPARKPLRRQMPEPLSSMSSYKEAMAKRAEFLKAAQAAQAAKSADAGEAEAAPQADEKDADNK